MQKRWSRSRKTVPTAASGSRCEARPGAWIASGTGSRLASTPIGTASPATWLQPVSINASSTSLWATRRKPCESVTVTYFRRTDARPSRASRSTRRGRNQGQPDSRFAPALRTRRDKLEESREAEILFSDGGEPISLIGSPFWALSQTIEPSGHSKAYGANVLTYDGLTLRSAIANMISTGRE